MKIVMRWSIVAGMGLGAAALVFGCGSGSTGTDTTGGSGGTGTGGSGPCSRGRDNPECLLALDAAAAELAAAVCTNYFNCYPVFALIEHGSIETCVPRYTEYYKNMSRLDGVAWLPEEMSACADVLDQPDCGSAFAPACSLPGEKDVGEACSISAECKSSRCVGASSSTCGKCEAVRVQGQPCASKDNDCAWGLVCNSSTHTCEPYRIEGESCSDHGDCYGTLVCLGEKCSKPLGDGEYCGTFGVCDLDQSLACFSDQKCGKFDIVGVGESCAQAICEYGTVCAGQKCTPRPLEGQSCATLPCISPARCVNGLCSLDFLQCP